MIINEVEEEIKEERKDIQTLYDERVHKVIFVMTFQSSKLEKPKAMHEYIANLLEDPYNKFCIDCKIALSTHCLVMYGAFMCE